MTSMTTKTTIVISLGGSIVHPRAGEINTFFLKKFREIILKFLGKGFRFIIIVGGGKICRVYQNAASEIIKKPTDEDKDWLGIHSSRLNAHLLRTIFRKEAYPVILDDPHKPIENHWRLLIASAWRPGWSTDYVSVLLAKRFKITEIINAGNIPFVYSKDPSKHKDAKIFEKISWQDYRKLIPARWTPGLSTPFDPIASKLAQKTKIRVFVLDGTDIKNFEKAISADPLTGGFRGTIIGY